MSLVMETTYFMHFHISLLGKFLSITNYVKQLLVKCQTLKNCLIIYPHIHIHYLLLLLAGLDMKPKLYMAFLCDTNTLALYLQHVGTNHI
uniref:Uncharacterized protein n=1 Tax=Amphimedon queenslandica TaxID=400682 RepID=A0A1X7V1I5_AMPQE